MHEPAASHSKEARQKSVYSQQSSGLNAAGAVLVRKQQMLSVAHAVLAQVCARSGQQTAGPRVKPV